MPLVEYDDLLPQGFAGPARFPTREVQRPGLLDTFGAAFQLENLLYDIRPFFEGRARERRFVSDPTDFDVLQNLQGTIFEGRPELWNALSHIRSREELLHVQRDVARELRNRRTIAEAGPVGMLAMMTAGMTSPDILIPTGAGLRLTGSVLATAGRAAVLNAGAVGAGELLRHETQAARTPEESAYAVSGAALIGAALGSLSGSVRPSRILRAGREFDQGDSLPARIQDDPPGRTFAQPGRVPRGPGSARERERVVDFVQRYRDWVRRVARRETPAEQPDDLGPMVIDAEFERVEPPEAPGPLLAVGIRFLPGVKAVQRAASRGEGIDVLRKESRAHFGNPFTSLQTRTRAAVQVESLEEAVSRYEGWLRGTSDQAIEPDRRRWIIDQIESGRLDEATLLYYSRQTPNHAQALARVIEESKAQRAQRPFRSHRATMAFEMKDGRILTEDDLRPIARDAGVNEVERDLITTHIGWLEAAGIDPDEVARSGFLSAQGRHVVGLQDVDRPVPRGTEPQAAVRTLDSLVEQRATRMGREPGAIAEGTTTERMSAREFLTEILPGMEREMFNTFADMLTGLQRAGVVTLADLRRAFLEERLPPPSVPRGTWEFMRQMAFTQAEHALLDSELVALARESEARILAIATALRRRPESLRALLGLSDEAEGRVVVPSRSVSKLDQALDAERQQAAAEVAQREQPIAASEATVRKAEDDVLQRPDSRAAKDRLDKAHAEDDTLRGLLDSARSAKAILDAERVDRPLQRARRAAQRKSRGEIDPDQILEPEETAEGRPFAEGETPQTGMRVRRPAGAGRFETGTLAGVRKGSVEVRFDQPPRTRREIELRDKKTLSADERRELREARDARVVSELSIRAEDVSSRPIFRGARPEAEPSREQRRSGLAPGRPRPIPGQQGGGPAGRVLRMDPSELEVLTRQGAPILETPAPEPARGIEARVGPDQIPMRGPGTGGRRTEPPADVTPLYASPQASERGAEIFGLGDYLQGGAPGSARASELFSLMRRRAQLGDDFAKANESMRRSRNQLLRQRSLAAKQRGASLKKIREALAIEQRKIGRDLAQLERGFQRRAKDLDEKIQRLSEAEPTTTRLRVLDDPVLGALAGTRDFDAPLTTTKERFLPEREPARFLDPESIDEPLLRKLQLQQNRPIEERLAALEVERFKLDPHERAELLDDMADQVMGLPRLADLTDQERALLLQGDSVGALEQVADRIFREAIERGEDPALAEALSIEVLDRAEFERVRQEAGEATSPFEMERTLERRAAEEEGAPDELGDDLADDLDAIENAIPDEDPEGSSGPLLSILMRFLPRERIRKPGTAGGGPPRPTRAVRIPHRPEEVPEGLAPIAGIEPDRLKWLLRHSPKFRTALSANPQIARLSQHLVDPGGLLFKKHFYGVATTSIEDLKLDAQAILAYHLEQLPRVYDQYVKWLKAGSESAEAGPPGTLRGGVLSNLRQRFGRGEVNQLSMPEIRRELGVAVIRGEHGIPALDAYAKEVTAKTYEPVLAEMVRIGMLPSGLRPSIARGYLTRLYKTDEIKARRQEWDDLLFNELTRRAREDGEVIDEAAWRSKIDEITERVLLGAKGRIQYDLGQDAGPRPKRSTRSEHQRDLDIPDEALLRGGFIETDIEKQLRYYYRSIVPDVLLARFHFEMTLERPEGFRPDPQLRPLVAEIERQYDAMIDQAQGPEKLRLARYRHRDVADIKAMIEELRGTLNMPEDPDAFVWRAMAATRRYNVMTQSGMFMLSSIIDVAHPVMMYGLQRVWGAGIRGAIADWRTFQLNAREVQTMGTANDMTINSRVGSIFDIGDEIGGNTRFENALRGGADLASILSLLSPWTQVTKQWAGATVMQLMAQDLMGWSGAKAAKIEDWARRGIDPGMLERIRVEVSRRVADGHTGENLPALGPEARAVHLGVEEWLDHEAAQAFRIAVRREVDNAIITPGIGDKPIWMTSEVGRFFFQYKSFPITATTRILLAGAQRADRAFWNGMLLSFMLGAASIYLKSAAANWPTPDPSTQKGLSWWLRNSIDRSGVFGVLHNANDFIGYATRGGLSAGRVLGGGPDPSFRYSKRNWLTELIGPSSGTFMNAVKTSQGLADILQGVAPSQASTHAFQRMLPYNNLFYLSRAVHRAVQAARGAGVEALNLEKPRTNLERERLRSERASGEGLGDTGTGGR